MSPAKKSRRNNTTSSETGPEEAKAKNPNNPFRRKRNEDNSPHAVISPTIKVPVAVLGTAEIRLRANETLTPGFRALCDNGAQLNLITSDCVARMKLQISMCSKIGISGYGNHEGGSSRQVVIADLCRRSGAPVLKQTIFVIVPEIVMDLPQEELHESFDSTIAEEFLADPLYHTPGPIDALLGAGVYSQIVHGGITRGQHGLYAILTELGWVISGNNLFHSDTVCYVMGAMDDKELNAALKRLWEENEIEGKIDHTPIERWCEENFETTHYRDEDGRYVVTIPIREGGEATLGESREMALKRLKSLERKFERDPEFKAKYVDFMREYQDLGHMQLAEEPVEKGDPSYYIPHHAVAEKTKFRVVYDASNPTSTGVSLNDIQLPGPKLQNNLFDVMIAFRIGEIAMTADISKMYRQIRINPKQLDLQRIVWRESIDEPIRDYQLTVVTYGMTSSGYNAIKAMNQCALDHEREFPLGADSIRNRFYVDDMLESRDTIAEMVERKSEIEAVLSKGGFSLAKWMSNAKELMGDGAQAEKCLDKDLTSVLGLNWIPKSDKITFKLRMKDCDSEITKRLIASLTGQFYDPLGLASPVTNEAKKFMQNAWRIGLSWDEPIPPDMKRAWIAFYQGLEKLAEIKIPRWLGMSRAAQTQMHVFCDASNAAYGAVIYTRTVQESGPIITNLVTSKGKLTALKAISTPRLELNAARMGAELADKVAKILQREKSQIYYWTDSEIVLCWLTKFPADLQTYVGNRVNIIQELSDVKAWAHVRSADNPADRVSRGMSAEKLITCDLWWKGPGFLAKTEDLWPKWVKGSLAKDEQEIADSEQRKKPAMMQPVVSLLTSRGQSGQDDDEMDVLSSRRKLAKTLRITAYVQRYVRILQAKVSNKKEANSCAMINVIRKRRAAKWPHKGSPEPTRKKFKVKTAAETEEELRLKTLISMIKPVTPQELSEALLYWIKFTQSEAFSEEIKALSKGDAVHKGSKLARFVPFIDDIGIIRMRGRLEHATMTYDEKHPILLPGNAVLSRRLIEEAHRETLHGQAQACLQYLREKYWITDARSIVRNWIRHCPRCIRFNQRMATQLMADLPAGRVTISRPFNHCGVDYAGPFKLSAYRGRGTKVELSAYVAIFVCFASKAVHLELVGDLSAKAFLAAFDRFTARRPHVEFMYSDNGTNFVAANKELRHAIDTWKSNEIIEQVSAKGITWRFNTPLASHQGGLWERAVQSMKYHMRRIIQCQTLTFEEMYTVLVRIEAALNSRPLTTLSDDPTDSTALTPGHFLTGGQIIRPLGPKVADIPLNRLSSWEQMHKIEQEFWNRWSVDYLHQLQQRNKWQRPSENIEVGELVYIRSDNTPPGQWARGRIIDTYPGRDQLVRSVRVRTENGEYDRPIHKLCPIPLMDPEHEPVAPNIDNLGHGAD